MKWYLIFAAVIVLEVIASILFPGQGLIFLVASLTAIVAMGTIYIIRPLVIKITRWAKSNPRKAQVFIAMMHIALMVLGIIAGNNFRELGIKLSSITPYAFGSLMVFGYMSAPFLHSRSKIAIPRVVNKHRLFYMCIALSSFIMMVYTGNRVGVVFPDSPISRAIETMDQQIFSIYSPLSSDLKDVSLNRISNNDQKDKLSPVASESAVFASYILSDEETITPSTDLKKESKINLKAEKKALKFEKRKSRLIHRFEKHRMTLAAGLTGSAILLIILLVILTCAGACLVAGGIAALVSGEIGGILAIVLGGFLGWLAIRGIVRINKSDKYRKK